MLSSGRYVSSIYLNRTRKHLGHTILQRRLPWHMRGSTSDTMVHQ